MLLVGSDPEAFVRSFSGRLVNAIGVIPGTKDNPHPTENGSIQHDNILAEFNSKPASTVDEFINNHKLIIKDLEDIIKPLGLKLDFVASAMAEDALLSESPLSRIAGCEPDFDAWSNTINTPADYMFNNMRAAGGHLHISFDCDTLDDRRDFIRALDLVLGVPSVILDPDQDRRKFYGRAGSFRPKFKSSNDPYNGAEYRTLSNFWLKSEDLMRFVWSGVETVNNNIKELNDLALSLKQDILDIINNGKQEEAMILCDKFGVTYAC